MSIPTDIVRKWRHRLNKAEAVNKKWRETFMIDTLDRYWEGHQKPTWWNESFFVPINLIFSNVQTQLDGLTAASPRYNVRIARSYDPSPDGLANLEAQLALRESLLNATVRSKKLKREVRKALLDAEIAFGVLKTYYVPYHVEERYRMKNEDGSIEEYKEKVLKTELFDIGRRDPKDIRFDPLADSIENITWVAERIEMSLAEVQSNKLFKNTDDLKAYSTRIDEKQDERDRKRGNDMAVMTGGNSSTSSIRSDDDQEKIVTLWEIYDLDEQKLITIAEWHDKPLRESAMPRGILEHPYVFIWYIDRRNSPYPIPGIWNQVGVQDEYNVTRNQLMLHRRRFNRKYTTQKGSMDPAEKAKLEDPYDGLIIETNTAGEVVHPIKDAPLDQAVYFDTSMLRKDFMDVAGEAVPDSDIAKIEKAAVAGMLASRQENRRRGKLTVVQDMYNAIACKLMSLYEAEMTLPIAVGLTGTQGQQWQPIMPEDLSTSNYGEYIYEVDTSSLIPQTPESERAAWIGLTQFIAMNPMVGSNPALVQKTAKMFGIEDKSLIQALVQTALAIQEQQKLQGGGQAGQPSMSGDMQKALGMPG